MIRGCAASIRVWYNHTVMKSMQDIVIGAELQHLRDWHTRLTSWLGSPRSANPYCWMYFLPCGRAGAAMMRLSSHFPYIVKHIDEMVDLCKRRLDQYVDANDELLCVDLCEAMSFLLDRISWGVEAIEQAQEQDAAESSVRWTRERLRKHLEKACDRGQMYTSTHEIAKRYRCSSSLVHNTIRGSKRLKAWQKRASPGPCSLPAIALDNIEDCQPQSIEPDPSDVLDDDEVDRVMQRLVNEADERERPKLLAVGSEERHNLVRAYLAQQDDLEPSPLEDDPPSRPPFRVKHFKRV